MSSPCFDYLKNECILASCPNRRRALRSRHASGPQATPCDTMCDDYVTRKVYRQRNYPRSWLSYGAPFLWWEYSESKLALAASMLMTWWLCLWRLEFHQSRCSCHTLRTPTRSFLSLVSRWPQGGYGTGCGQIGKYPPFREQSWNSFRKLSRHGNSRSWSSNGLPRLMTR